MFILVRVNALAFQRPDFQMIREPVGKSHKQDNIVEDEKYIRYFLYIPLLEQFQVFF